MAIPGLTTTEVERRLEESGPNEVRQRGRISVWSSIGLQLRDPLILVLAVAGVYLAVLQALLGTESLPLPELLLATALGVVGWVAVRLTRRGRGHQAGRRHD